MHKSKMKHEEHAHHKKEKHNEEHKHHKKEHHKKSSSTALKAKMAKG
jgi:hypothetical protein